MHPDELDDIATQLLAAYDNATLIEPPSRRGSFSMDEAYAVGERLVQRRQARGEQTVGRKIGFTNTTIWAEYGVDRPMWAHVYAGTVVNAPDGMAHISLAGTLAQRIEPEVVFGLAHDIAPDCTAPAALLEQIGWLALGFEIVDCHTPDWRFTSAECTADFGLHARLVIGQRVETASLHDLEAALARFTLTLYHDEQVADSGGGANVLGSPLQALSFLVATLAALGAEPLRAGEVVTTGTLTRALPIAPGQTWRSAAGGIALPGLSMQLTE